MPCRAKSCHTVSFPCHAERPMARKIPRWLAGGRGGGSTESQGTGVEAGIPFPSRIEPFFYSPPSRRERRTPNHSTTSRTSMPWPLSRTYPNHPPVLSYLELALPRHPPQLNSPSLYLVTALRPCEPCGRYESLSCWDRSHQTKREKNDATRQPWMQGRRRCCSSVHSAVYPSVGR